MRIGQFASLFVSVVAATFLLSSAATADTESPCEGGTCPTTAKSDCATGECPVSTAVAKSMKALPQLAFVMGDECTQCEKTATAWAGSQQKPLQYAVGDKKFAEKGQAYDALIAQTESMLASFITPETCSKSGMTTIAGDSCDCSMKAGQIAKHVKDAAANVTVAYRVGNETCSCPKQSAAMAKAEGVERTFLVGDVETTCPKTARLAYARARYEAAAKAAAELKIASAQ